MKRSNKIPAVLPEQVPPAAVLSWPEGPSLRAGAGGVVRSSGSPLMVVKQKNRTPALFREWIGCMA